VEPEVNKILATLSSVTALRARSRLLCRARTQQVVEQFGTGRRLGRDHHGNSRQGLQSRAETGAVVGEDRTRPDEFGDRFDPRMILALQRIRDARRDHRHPAVSAPKAIRKCSIELPDRINSGLSWPSPRLSNTWPNASAASTTAP
jgi:hypothetical protein